VVPELKLNLYIAISFLFHFLLLSILLAVPPQWVVRSAVFNVNIVDYIEIPATREGSRVQGVRIQKDRALDSSPQSIHGEGTNQGVRIQKDRALDSPPQSIHGEGTNNRGSESLNGSTQNTLSDRGRGLPSEPEGLPLKPKPNLFDKETIEKFAKKAPEEKELTFDSREFRHRGYLRMLKEKIESIWRYPAEAARRGISGDLYIRFSIKRDGRLGGVELLRTSGHKDLDEAAMKALWDAEPYWPLPEDFHKEEIEIIGHFIYLLGRYYIM